MKAHRDLRAFARISKPNLGNAVIAAGHCRGGLDGFSTRNAHIEARQRALAMQTRSGRIQLDSVNDRKMQSPPREDARLDRRFSLWP